MKESVHNQVGRFSEKTARTELCWRENRVGTRLRSWKQASSSRHGTGVFRVSLVETWKDGSMKRDVSTLALVLALLSWAVIPWGAASAETADRDVSKGE